MRKKFIINKRITGRGSAVCFIEKIKCKNASMDILYYLIISVCIILVAKETQMKNLFYEYHISFYISIYSNKNEQQ